MMLKIKQIGMLLVTMSAMLVLFAGCGDKDDGATRSPRDARCRDREQFNHNEQDFDPRPVGHHLRGDDRLAGRGCGVVFVRFE